MRGHWRWALAGAALAGLLSGPAAAQGFFMDHSWYIKGFGGATFPQDDDFELDERAGPLSVDTGLNYDTGYVLGIAAGVGLTPNVAVELEYAYRNADAEFKNSGGVNAKTESNAFMVNALYKFTPLGANGEWQPYVGGGLGAADLNIEDLPSEAGGDLDSDYNFAYQVIGGVGYAINPNLSLNGELRFFGINDQDLENDDLSLKTTYHTIDLLVGLTYSF
jgi:opacity protein-like surface antigen